MKKFLILGGESTLAKYFLERYGKLSVPLNKKECNITNIKNLEEVIKKNNCKYVINCAAITDIQYSEINPEECFETNSIAVYQIGRLCDKYNKKLIHLSSDYALHPINVYGYSKLISEGVIDLTKNLVIRTSFYSPKYFIIKSLFDSKKTKVYKNVFFNPVSVNRLINEIYNNRDKKGMLSIFSDKKISKYTFAIKIAKTFGLNRKLIHPINLINRPGQTPLPLNSYVKSDVKISIDKDLFLFKEISNVFLRH